MAREIDLSKGLESLSKEDLVYLRDRGRLTPDQEKQYLGSNTGSPVLPPTSLGDTPNVGDVGTVADDVNLGGQGTPLTESSRSTGNQSGNNDVYADASKAELRAEIDQRNDGRDEDYRIAVSGTAEELADRLREDDATYGTEPSVGG